MARIVDDHSIAEQAIHIVAKRYGIEQSVLTGYCRRRRHVRARNTAIRLIDRYTDLSLAEIGALFSDRHHTSILHALNSPRHDLAAFDEVDEVEVADA